MSFVFIIMYVYMPFFFQHPHLGSRGRQCRGLSDDQRQVLQMFDPACDISRDGSYDKMAAYNRDTIGFFIAKFTKIKKWKWNTMLLSLFFWRRGFENIGNLCLFRKYFIMIMDQLSHCYAFWLFFGWKMYELAHLIDQSLILRSLKWFIETITNESWIVWIRSIVVL